MFNIKITDLDDQTVICDENSSVVFAATNIDGGEGQVLLQFHDTFEVTRKLLDLVTEASMRAALVILAKETNNGGLT